MSDNKQEEAVRGNWEPVAHTERVRCGNPPPKTVRTKVLLHSPQGLITLAGITELRYYCAMIRSFKCSETEKIYGREHSRKLPQAIQRTAMRKLWVLDAVTELNELRVPPSNRLEPLHGDRQGQHSIRINQQWRLCFRWRDGDAYDVEIVDYH